MALNGNDLCKGVHIQANTSNGLRVRDMIRRYDTAVNSNSASSSYSSIISSKPSYFGVKSNTPVIDVSSNSIFATTGSKNQELRTSPSNSCEFQKTVQQGSPPRESHDEPKPMIQSQKSFMNLSRIREPPIAAPREKKPRQSSSILKQQPKEHKAEMTYKSKTTISKTADGIRITIDIMFDQNNEPTIGDVMRSRIETDIRPSKILSEFQKRVADSIQNSQP